MPSHWQTPDFSTEPWYSDPNDPRCPLDATLESVEISEPASSTSNHPRRAEIIVTLLSAHHKGTHLFSYFGVAHHSVTCYQCDQGAGTWLRDEFSRSENGLTEHRIIWRPIEGERSQWIIKAEKIEFRWV